MKKGAATRARILDRAVQLAGLHGVQGVTLGTLAGELGLSKSGLFAHFASKEDLSVEVLRTMTERFAEQVVRPALAAPRGEPRIAKIFENWVAWLKHPAQSHGCPMVAASVELDDKPGLPRDFLAGAQKTLLGTLARAAALAVEEGHFRKNVDCELFAFEWLGIMLAYHHSTRLLRDRRALERARAAFERLLTTSRSK